MRKDLEVGIIGWTSLFLFGAVLLLTSCNTTMRTDTASRELIEILKTTGFPEPDGMIPEYAGVSKLDFNNWAWGHPKEAAQVAAVCRKGLAETATKDTWTEGSWQHNLCIVSINATFFNSQGQDIKPRPKGFIATDWKPVTKTK